MLLEPSEGTPPVFHEFLIDLCSLPPFPLCYSILFVIFLPFFALGQDIGNGDFSLGLDVERDIEVFVGKNIFIDGKRISLISVLTDPDGPKQITLAFYNSDGTVEKFYALYENS